MEEEDLHSPLSLHISFTGSVAAAADSASSSLAYTCQTFPLLHSLQQPPSLKCATLDHSSQVSALAILSSLPIPLVMPHHCYPCSWIPCPRLWRSLRPHHLGHPLHLHGLTLMCSQRTPTASSVNDVVRETMFPDGTATVSFATWMEKEPNHLPPT